MNYIRKIITKYSRIKKDKLLKKVDKNYELNTFEFFEVKKFYKKVANEKKLLKIKNSWIQLFKNSRAI